MCSRLDEPDTEAIAQEATKRAIAKDGTHIQFVYDSMLELRRVRRVESHETRGILDRMLTLLREHETATPLKDPELEAIAQQAAKVLKADGKAMASQYIFGALEAKSLYPRGFPNECKLKAWELYAIADRSQAIADTLPTYAVVSIGLREPTMRPICSGHPETKQVVTALQLLGFEHVGPPNLGVWSIIAHDAEVAMDLMRQQFPRTLRFVVHSGLTSPTQAG